MISTTLFSSVKRAITYSLVALLAITSAMQSFSVSAVEPNLILNGSAEASNASGPTNWTANSWGANTSSLTYATTGYNSAKSFYVSMSARTDGDAKWVHDAVNVQAGASYTYSSWYKSSVATEIDVQYTSTTGVVTYGYITTVAPSANWSQLTSTFVIPANIAKVSVMHVIATPGWLQYDDISLKPTVTAPPAEQNNYVRNSSFETSNAGTPANWNKNNWGTNTSTFSYESTGRTGSKSAKITTTAYTSGDAKWYADAVPVTPFTSYQYRDYYKANVATRVVVAFTDASGAATYTELASAPASASAWALYSATFTAPSTAVKASVYHLLDKVGSLTLDDINLYVAPTAPTGPVIANPSMETAGVDGPVNWNKNSWGTNTPLFQYVNEGYTGTKSTKVTVSNYVDGDAKWFFDPMTSLKVGSQYRFTAWYKTNITPRIVVMFIMADGSARYYAMPVAQPATNSTTVWQKYSDTFSVPVGAVSGSVFMYINQNGWLQTDDYNVAEYSPIGFSRPLVSLTFDDSHEDNVTSALPILNQYGLKTTQCFATSFIEGKSQAVIDGVKAFYDAGHEICSHTVTHPFLTSLTGASLTNELQSSQQYLQTLIGQPVTSFASSYGDYNAATIVQLKKYYQLHRSVDDGYNSKDNFNAYNLRVKSILNTTTATDVANWIARAKADKTWLILVYHRIANNPGPYDTTVNNFTAQMQAVVESGVTVSTMKDAFAETKSQLP